MDQELSYTAFKGHTMIANGALVEVLPENWSFGHGVAQYVT